MSHVQDSLCRSGYGGSDDDRDGHAENPAVRDMTARTEEGDTDYQSVSPSPNRDETEEDEFSRELSRWGENPRLMAAEYKFRASMAGEVHSLHEYCSQNDVTKSRSIMLSAAHFGSEEMMKQILSNVSEEEAKSWKKALQTDRAGFETSLKTGSLMMFDAVRELMTKLPPLPQEKALKHWTKFTESKSRPEKSRILEWKRNDTKKWDQFIDFLSEESIKLKSVGDLA